MDQSLRDKGSPFDVAQDGGGDGCRFHAEYDASDAGPGLGRRMQSVGGEIKEMERGYVERVSKARDNFIKIKRFPGSKH